MFKIVSSRERDGGEEIWSNPWVGASLFHAIFNSYHIMIQFFSLHHVLIIQLDSIHLLKA